jgi:hypothetical protein
VTDIVEFLRARYTADEAIARAAGNGNDLSWAGWQLGGQLEEAGWEHPETVNREAHVLRHDPASVLADIDAKLRLLEQFELRGNSVRATVVPATGGVWDDLLRLLALPFAGHADYDRRWRPADV